MLTFLKFWAGADMDLIARFSLEPHWTWTLPLGADRNAFIGLRELGLLVSTEDKDLSSEDSGPVQSPAQVTLTRWASKGTHTGA